MKWLPSTVSSKGQSEKNRSSQHASQAATASWATLKQVLKTVRDGSDLFPPLKAALVGVVAAMDAVDVREVSSFCSRTLY